MKVRKNFTCLATYERLREDQVLVNAVFGNEIGDRVEIVAVDSGVELLDDIRSRIDRGRRSRRRDRGFCSGLA